MTVHGYQRIHREEIRIGPDGKPVKNVYTLTRELNEKQAAELLAEPLFGPLKGILGEMERFMGDVFNAGWSVTRRTRERKGRK